MKPGDRLVTALIDSCQAGETFQSWPLHVTIVAWFQSDVSSGELASLLTRALQGIDPFAVIIGEEVQLGYQGKRAVNLVQLPSPFIDVQQRVEQTLDENGAILLTKRGTRGETYTPHVTVQNSKRVHAGEHFDCDRLYIVSQQGDHKRIDAVVRLGTITS